MTDNAIIIITFIFYLAAMLCIGIIAWRRTGNLSDYILGGRRLGSLSAALSAAASDMSGWLLMGLPGYAYIAGLEAGWLALGLLAGTWLNWHIVARRLREQSAFKGNALTLPDFFEMRFNDKSRLLRIISSSFILVFFTFYTSSGLVAGAKLFNAVFGLDYHTALLTGTAAVVVYTFMGGFMAVCWTDCIQGILMLLALLLVPAIALTTMADSSAFAMADRISPTIFNPFLTAPDKPIGIITIISLLAWGLGYFGQPHILARFMAIKSPSHIPRAKLIAVTWSAITLACAILAGISAIGIPISDLPNGDSEKIFIYLVQVFLNPIPAGICLAAILAAIMSTADSQLLVSSSALVEDFYRAFLRKKASDRELVRAGRAAVILIALIALAISFNPESRVLDIVSYAWAGFGAAFGPALILSLYWKNMTRNGALAGIVCGGSSVLAWKPVVHFVAERHPYSIIVQAAEKLYEIVPAFFAATAAIIIVSLLGKKHCRQNPTSANQPG